MNIYDLEQDPEASKAGISKNRDRKGLHQDILTSLGAPTIRVELTPGQIDQAINSALRQFWTNHRDGSFENYYFIQLDQTMVTQGFIKTPEWIDAVVEVLPKGFGRGDGNFANLEWQLTVAALPGAQGGSTAYGTSYAVNGNAAAGGVGGSFDGVQGVSRGLLNQFSFSDFLIAKEGLATMRKMTGQDIRHFNFVRYQRRLYLRFPTKVGDYIAFRCYENVDPDRQPELCGELFDDETLKNLAVANAKVIWGSVLRKFGGIQLPGGVTLEGDTLVEEGNAEQERIITEMKTSQPIDFFVG